MSLKTDFKDEILQEGEEHRRYNIKRSDTNEVVENDVYLERADTPQQVGDDFSAGDLNQMTTILNKVVSDGIFFKKG